MAAEAVNSIRHHVACRVSGGKDEIGYLGANFGVREGLGACCGVAGDDLGEEGAPI